VETLRGDLLRERRSDRREGGRKRKEWVDISSIAEIIARAGEALSGDLVNRKI